MRTRLLTLLAFAALLLVVGVVSVPRPGSTGATALAAGQNYAVPARAGEGGVWFSTGLSLQPSQVVSVSASGSIIWCASSCTSGPDGPTFAVTGCPGSLLAPSLPALSLIGRVGAGSPVLIGSGPTRVSGSGVLQFAVNDCYFPDNTGIFAVSVTPVDTQPPAVTLRFAPNGANGWFTTPLAVGAVSADDTQTGGSAIAAISCTGATVGPLTAAGPAGAQASVTVTGEGSHIVACTATDSAGNTSAAGSGGSQATVKIDSIAPICRATATPDSVWPPNHKFVPVHVDVAVSDAGSGPGGFSVRATSASEDPGDLTGFAVGSPATSGAVAANKGEVYTVTYRATDQAGNVSAPCTATVSVPHDQGH